MSPMDLQTKNKYQTLHLGQIMGDILPPKTILSLEGDLGSGKTIFVKGLALGLHIAQKITSPTFALVQIYSGKLDLTHADLYRLKEKEILEMGLEDYWRSPLFSPSWILAIEWGDKADAILPTLEKSISIFHLRFRILSKYSRNINIEGPKRWLNKIQTSWQKS